MLFNLGFTADAAAAHAEEDEKKTTTTPRRLMPLPSLPDFFASASNNSTPTPTPPLSSKPSHQTITSLSADIDNGHHDDNDEDDDATPTTIPRPAAARARAARPKTLFQFAHPVASQRHRRLTLRPKLLLQLHESNAMSRPFPKYDVLPAAIAPRLACKFPKLFASLRGLGPRDLVVVTSDMYEQHADDDRSDWSEDSSQDQREVVATICQPFVKDDSQPRPASVEIFSGLGVSWTGGRLPNGSYELVCSAGSQQQGRKARWVARDKASRKASGTNSSSSSSADPLKRFTFSVIDPNSRRHPVIASMTRSGIDVFEQYAYPAALSPSDEAPSSSSSSSSPPQSPRELVDLDEELRVLIVTSGIWIAFMEGWAKNPNDALCPTDSSQPSLRSKSSTFPGPERNPSSEAATETSSRKTKNRSSTQSEIGPLRQGTLRAAKARYRQSLTNAESHDQKWTNLETGGGESEKAAEDNPASKGKSWRRLSAMFGKNKGS